MNRYTFGVWIDIDAENEEDALNLYDDVIKNYWVKDSYCFEWKKIT